MITRKEKSEQDEVFNSHACHLLSELMLLNSDDVSISSLMRANLWVGSSPVSQYVRISPLPCNAHKHLTNECRTQVGRAPHLDRDDAPLLATVSAQVLQEVVRGVRHVDLERLPGTLHPGGRVHRVAEEAVPRHFQAHHSRHARSLDQKLESVTPNVVQSYRNVCQF